MKRYIALVLFLIPHMHGIAQLEVLESPKEIVVGQIKLGGALAAKPSYTIDSLLYRHAGYEYVTSFEEVKFNADKQTLDQLYSLMMSVFTKENSKNKEYKVEMMLGTTPVIISSRRSMGITGVMFFTSKGYTILSKNQVNKLFGKKD